MAQDLGSVEAAAVGPQVDGIERTDVDASAAPSAPLGIHPGTEFVIFQEDLGGASRHLSGQRCARLEGVDAIQGARQNPVQPGLRTVEEGEIVPVELLQPDQVLGDRQGEHFLIGQQRMSVRQ